MLTFVSISASVDMLQQVSSHNIHHVSQQDPAGTFKFLQLIVPLVSVTSVSAPTSPFAQHTRFSLHLFTARNKNKLEANELHANHGKAWDVWHIMSSVKNKKFPREGLAQLRPSFDWFNIFLLLRPCDYRALGNSMVG